MEKEEMEEMQEDEINLLDYLIVLAKRKRLIAGFTLVVTILTAVYSLIMSPLYKAETTILPPQDSRPDIQTQLLSRFEGITGISSNVLGEKSIFMDVIKSRTVLDRIIERFGLMELYDTTYLTDARRKLESEVNVKSDKTSRLISIGVVNKDPKLAADIANAFVDELINVVQNLAVTEASRRRLFFEKELKQAKDALIGSEEAMQKFQEQTGVLQVEDQAKAVIESIADLRAQIAAKEVQLKVMKTYTTANNPDLQKLEETLKGLKIELGKLEEKTGSRPDPLMPTGRMALVGTDYVRKLRDLKFNETLYELMSKQYEIARIDEARDAAIIQVIDPAIPPEKKFKPARTRMVTIAFFVSLFFAVFLAFFMEYVQKVTAEGSSEERIQTLKKYLSMKR
jgi:tyrosine-protein kinase Etk/Wzc